MAKIDDILRRMRTVPHDVPFDDLAKLCEHCFGEPRQQGTSHRVYRMPWPGDPRVNIQRGKDGKAKAYQVKQVLQAIQKLETEKQKTSGRDDDHAE
ncbi:toxin HicA [Roseomonas genomospecies 6]|uniref:Toxin HicA n=1 Tax=Roseomonas genomospecies 6 TaxID=214106 RepID=A0A9W7KQ24_9PROT|nr:toxin HicA [Roseomonas genomospecies 6]KAA0677091.1 toxin HicA [Roseomonas genomospecies 6]